MDCIFCKIVAGEIPNYTLGENEDALAFLDVQPVASGHALVIPKVHAETLLDLPNKHIEGLWVLVKEVTQRIQDALAPDGFNIGANMHKAGGQAVEHLHIHIIPRWHNDGGGNMHSIVDSPPEESVEEVHTNIMSKTNGA